MLLAQSTGPVPTWTWMAISVFVVAVLLCVFVLLVVLLFRHLRAGRAFLHTERMRSLEAGIPFEASEATKVQAKFIHNAFWISFWLVFSVPTAALSAASAATKTGDESLTLSIVVWAAATVVSVAAVLGATTLMIYSRSSSTDNGFGLQKMTKRF